VKTSALEENLLINTLYGTETS